MPEEKYTTFESIKSRLEDITRLVGDDSMSLDEALDLYEEAVNLGLLASDFLEEDTQTSCITEKTTDVVIQKTETHAADIRTGDKDVGTNSDKSVSI